MQLDPGDIFAGTVGRIILRALIFLSAVWIGSMVGGLALIAGDSWDDWRDGIRSLGWIWASPVLLVSVWIVLNAFVLLGGLAYFIISESPGFLAWGLLVGLESLFVMAAWAGDLDAPLPIAIAWVSWLLVLGMLETGILADPPDGHQPMGAAAGGAEHGKCPRPHGAGSGRAAADESGKGSGLSAIYSGRLLAMTSQRCLKVELLCDSTAAAERARARFPASQS